MEYAKIINGKIRIVPFEIFTGSPFAKAPTHEQLVSTGWMPVDESEKPEVKDGYVAHEKYVQTDSAIVKKWTVLPDRRPMSQSTVNKMLISQQINTLEVDDNTALRMKQFYPTFDEIVGQKVKQGFKFRHGDYLWATVKELTIQSHYAPGDGMESLYTKVNETHAGTLEDPIPYDGNMALENGKHYSQYSTIYLCNRDTGNPVYHKLSELVGQFVVEV